MARGVTIKIGGNKYYMVYNAEAHFRALDKYGDEAYKTVLLPTREGWDVTVELIVIALEQGELCRRAIGHDRGEIPTAETIRAFANMNDVVFLKNKLLESMTINVNREVNETGEVDEGLAELEKKTQITD
jgi:hypothetical protein